MTSQEQDEREFASPMLAETPKAKKVRPARRETLNENIVVHDHTEYLSAGFRRGSKVPKHTPITREVSPRLPRRFLNVVDDPTDEDYAPSSKKLPPSRRALATGRSDNANMTSTEDAPLPAPPQEDENRSIGPGAIALLSTYSPSPPKATLAQSSGG